MSSDWINWLTIADKNLWATQVWNDWDTLSQTNCWNFYEWWNNYGIPRDFQWVSVSTNAIDFTNYGSYYESSSFYKNWADSWSTVNNPNLRGETTNTNEARRWPCPDWFHIPSLSDANNLKSALEELSIDVSTNGENVRAYLKMPYARNYTGHSTVQANYWLSTPSSSTVSYCIRFSPTWILFPVTDFMVEWMSIRPFKNTFVLPWSSWSWAWTILYWSSFWSNWIYRNPGSWLISIYTSSYQITIADKNLWATQAYNVWDAECEANCGKYYQWWNNHWFPRWYWPIVSSPKVDWSKYWPYYYNSTIYHADNWQWVTWHYNLWWWLVDTPESKRWPCAEWFHIPSSAEVRKMIDIQNDFTSIAWDFYKYIKLPLAWYWNRTQWWVSQVDAGVQWLYHTVSCYHDDYDNTDQLVRFMSYPSFIWWQVSTISGGMYYWWTNSIRPFKNESVIPDNSWSVIYSAEPAAQITWEWAWTWQADLIFKFYWLTQAMYNNIYFVFSDWENYLHINSFDFTDTYTQRVRWNSWTTKTYTLVMFAYRENVWGSDVYHYYYNIYWSPVTVTFP